MNRSPYLYTALRVAPLVVSTLGTLALARQLGVTEFGHYATAGAFAQIVTAVGLFGQDQLIMQGRLGPRTGLVRSAITIIFSTVLGLALGLMLLPDRLYPMLILLLLSTGLATWVGSMLLYVQYEGRDVQRAMFDLELRVAIQASANGLAMASAKASAAASGGLIGALLAGSFVASRFMSVGSRWKSRYAAHQARFRDGMSFGMVGLLFSITLVVPQVIIAATAGPQANAYGRMVILWYSAITAVGAATCGEYYRVRLYAAVTWQARREISGQMFRMLGLSSLVFTSATLLAAVLLPKVLGDQYSPVGIGIAVLAADVVPQFASIAFGTLLVSNGHIVPNMTRHAMACVFTIMACLTISPLTPLNLAVILVVNDLVGVAWYWGTRSRWGVTKTSALRMPIGDRGPHGDEDAATHPSGVG